MKLIIVGPPIDVYINGRDRKPPVLDWAARGVAKYRSIRLLCVRTKSRQGHQGQQLGRGRRDESPVATIAFAGACSCEHWLSRRRIPRRATSVQGDRYDTGDGGSQYRLVSVVICICPPPYFDSAAIGRYS